VDVEYVPLATDVLTSTSTVIVHDPLAGIVPPDKTKNVVPENDPPHEDAGVPLLTRPEGLDMLYVKDADVAADALWFSSVNTNVATAPAMTGSSVNSSPIAMLETLKLLDAVPYVPPAVSVNSLVVLVYVPDAAAAGISNVTVMAQLAPTASEPPE